MFEDTGTPGPLWSRPAGRYWEAVTQLHVMYSKWADAFSQFYGFSEVTLKAAKEKKDEEKVKPLGYADGEGLQVHGGALGLHENRFIFFLYLSLKCLFWVLLTLE